ncbi:MAG: 4-alpha-glucanotransferase, partial [Verrucomicrobiota bacterium]
LQATGLPGMAVLQFAFGGSEKNAYLPHNHKPNSVVYPGTHDNTTSKAWYASLDELTKDHVRRTLSVPGDAIEWDLIRAAYASVARMAIFPLQDLMSLGGEARLNTPGAATGNWQWRYHPEQLDALEGQSSSYLRELAGYHNR